MNAVKIKGFDFKNLNTKVRPQDDFFQFAAGGWIARNPIPATKSRWGTFEVRREENLKRLREIAEETVEKKGVQKKSERQLVRDFYLSGIDMKARNKLDVKPVQPFLNEIDALTSVDDLIGFITKMHRRGFTLLWGVFVGQDDKNSDRYITHIGQSGLSLPDRDFYLMQDKRSTAIRAQFKRHITNTLVLAGTSKAQARRDAGRIIEFETKLARISMDKVSARDINKTYNKKTIGELQKMAPGVPWKPFFKNIGLQSAQTVNVMQPAFLVKATKLLRTVPLQTWKTYLRWIALSDAAPFLSKPFVDQHFAFYGKALTGQQKQEPEWKRVIRVLNHYVGDALGKEYVRRHFPPEAKQKVDELVNHLFAAYRERIESLDWMSERTKRKALKKLATMNRKIGYPDKWKSYKGLRVESNAYYENVLRSMEYEQKREFKRLGKKIDRNEWFMTPQTVNAYYHPNMNDIGFPAGILQPPFFDPNADAAFNYGAIGAVIGHEMTHGFDEMGAEFDEKGNFKNWWTKEDKRRFKQKAAKLVTQFNQYQVGDLHVNGKFTLGENIADLGGVALAYDAYMKHLRHTKRQTVNKFTPEQRFFLGFSIFEAGHSRPERERTLVLTDCHSPNKFRVNGPVSNLPSFYEAFGVQEDDNLYRNPRERAKIW